MKSLILFLTFTLASAQKLPNYIKKCDNKSPTYDLCAVEKANFAIPKIVKGDKNYNIPKLDPLNLPLIEVQHNDFKLKLKNTVISGLQDIRATKLKINRLSFNAVFHIEHLNILGTHEISGRVLLLNLQGTGQANITGVGGEYMVKAAFIPYSKNGETYLKFEKPQIEFTLKQAYFDFENIFNGDERLGAEINKVLNDNWKDVLIDVGAPIKETVSTIVEAIVANILEKVPADEILPK